MALPAVLLSSVIGKGGAGVKEINQKSGASLKILSVRRERREGGRGGGLALMSA